MTPKKIIFLFLKSLFAIVCLLTLILFFYAGFFYDPQSAVVNIDKDEIAKNELEKKLEEEKIKLEEEIQKKIIEEEKQKKIQKVYKIETNIKDGLFATVGNRPITSSDIINEIKITLILNNLSYSEDKKKELQQMAVRSVLKRNIKQIAIEEKKDFLSFSQEEFNKELKRLLKAIKMDLKTLKEICKSNNLDYLLIEDQLKVELLWNSLIFAQYRDKLKINSEEIEEQLKLIQTKKDVYDYLVSEIIIPSVETTKIKSRVKEIKDKIKKDSFEKVAMNESVSRTAIKGGDLGWLNENEISKKYLSKISKTSVGGLSEEILLPDGILIFKVRDKRKSSKELGLEEIKNQLINTEKTKMLNMYALSHYDNLRRSVTIKFFNE